MKVEGDLQRVVDQRVARLLVATGKSDEAIKLLGSATDSSSLEIHGDALMAQGKRDEARAQYEKALKTLDVAAQRRLLETKVMDAGGTVAPCGVGLMSQKVMITRVATVLLMGMALTGCSTMKGWFAGKDAAAKKAQEPAELVKFEPTVKVSKVWSVNLGKGERRIGVRQGPAVANGHVFAAAITGGVHAIDLQTGKKVWTGSRRRKRRPSCACPAARVSVRTWS